MLSPDMIRELQGQWFPNITSTGLDRLIELLEQGSPLLVHGSFLGILPMGCLATHAAWHHPRTGHLTVDAGITWLHQVAGLNPATSHVIREWDRRGPHDLAFRFQLLQLFKEERLNRRRKKGPTHRTARLLGV